MKRNKCNSTFLVLTVALYILVSQSTLAQKIKISCVGNSITYGYGLSNPSSQSYPGQMQVLLGTTGWQVRNFGSSGRTMLKSGGYSYWDDQLYKDALAFNPDVVMIELGTNDSKRWLWNSHGSEFKTDYKKMVQSFQNLSTNPDIWIGLLIPGEKSDWDIYNSYIKDKVNPKIKEIALEMGLGLIDLYSEFDSISSEWYLVDSVHPSVAGSGIIAHKVKEMLLKPKPEIEFVNGKVIAPDGEGFQWYISGIPVEENKGGRLKELVVSKSGTYKVSVKLSANNETRIVSKELYVSGPDGIDKIEVKNEIGVYPNPACDIIYVQSRNLGKNIGYKITDLSGNQVLSGQIPNNNGKINVGSLSAGAYLLVMGNEYMKMVKCK